MNTHAAMLHDDCGNIAMRRFATARGAAHIAITKAFLKRVMKRALANMRKERAA